MKKVDYFFDFLSPFSFFSWKSSKKLRTDKNLDIALKPVVMGTLFNYWQIKGPGEIAPKRHQMLKQCFQYAALHNIKFTPPKTHPFNPLYALRLATLACAQEDQEKIIDRLWDLCWSEGQQLDDADFLSSELDKIGLDGAKLIEKTFEREVKQQLKQNTKEAIAYKAFGVPSFVYNNELFWGNDALIFLERALSDSPLLWDKDLFLDRSKDIILE